MKKDVNVAAQEAEWLPEISSDFLLLDVMKGRKELERLVSGNGLKPRLVIEVDVDYVWGGDDGISQEFACMVKEMRWLSK